MAASREGTTATDIFRSRNSRPKSSSVAGAMLGTIWRLLCTACDHAAEDRRVPLPELPPRCSCGALLRPGVVWFGEALPEEALLRAFEAARTAEVVLVVGTSSLVYPAAALPQVAQAAGGFVIEVNPEATPLSQTADLSLRGPAASLVPALVEER